MVFSKTERMVLKHIVNNDYIWLREKFSSVDKTENYKKQNHFNVIKSRIKKKVKRMKEDLDLYNQLSDERMKNFFL